MKNERTIAFEYVLRYCDVQIESVKKDNPEPNTPRQITNGGKLLAYNKIKGRLTAFINTSQGYDEKQDNLWDEIGRDLNEDNFPTGQIESLLIYWKNKYRIRRNTKKQNLE
jgi:hypothetical protein